MSQPDLATKQAIQEALARSAYALDERQMDLLEAGFTEDATLEIKIAGAEPILFESRDTIMGLMRDAADTQTDIRRHLINNLYFQDTNSDGLVQCTANLTITSVENGAICLVTSGYYRDSFEHHNGQWLIAHRCIDLDMAY